MLITRKILVALAACVSVASCGGGGGSGSSNSPPPAPPPPPPPPVVNPAAPLAISAANAESVLAFGAGIPEAVYGTAVFAANHLSEIASTSDNPSQVSCDSGGPSSVVNLDEDGSGTLTPGDTVNVFAPMGCFERLFADQVSGDFDITLTDVYTGVFNDALFEGTIALTSTFQVDSQDGAGAPITITLVGDVEFSVALRGSFIQALSLSLDAGNELVVTVGTNLTDPVVERIVSLEFLRRTFPSTGQEDNYLFRFDFALESEGLGGSIACQTSADIRGRDPSDPQSGRFVCNGANNSGVALVSDRLDFNTPLSLELDEDGDGTFVPLATADLFWDDFVEGQLFNEDIDGIFSPPESRAFGTVPVQTITAAVNDIIYNPVNDRLYISNSTGIVELDPANLGVLRSANVTDNPTELALSDDGSTLWFGLTNVTEAGRLDIASMTPGARVELGVTPPFGDDRIVNDILVAPGSTDDIVITMLGSEEVVAFDNGVELPNRIDRRGPSEIVFRDADSLVGVNDTNSGFDTFTISYDSQTGVVIDDTFPGLSPGFSSPLQLGSVDIWNSQGFSFNEIEEVRTGLINSEVEQFSPSYEYAVVSPADGLVYAIDRFSDILEVFDETTRARIAAYSFDGNEFDPFFVRGAVVTADALIVAGDSRIARFAKTDLQPNMPSACTVLSVGDLLADGVYDTFSCKARDIAYSPGRDLLYAAIPGAIGPQGNSIAVIDPETFTVQSFIPLTAEPMSIDISDDDAVLTATLREASQLAEIDLATQTLARTTALGFEIINGTTRFDPLTARSARARPGFPNEIVVSTNQREVYLYVDGVQLPTTPRAFDDYTRLFFDETDSTRLIGHISGEVGSYRLNGAGLDSLGTTRDILPGITIARRGNRLLNGRGEDLDIGTLIGSEICDFGDPDFAFRAVAFGTDSNTAFFAEPRAGHELYRCDLATGQLSGPTRVSIFTERTTDRAQRLYQLNSGDLAYLHEATLLKLAAPD